LKNLIHILMIIYLALIFLEAIKNADAMQEYDELTKNGPFNV